MNGFATWLPIGFTGSKTLPFILKGGFELIIHSGVGIIGRLLTYENYAMGLKKDYIDNYDWYLYNLSIKKMLRERGLQANCCAQC